MTTTPPTRTCWPPTPRSGGDSLESYVGQDLSLEKVLCTFGVDDQGRLTDNQVEVTFTTTDEAGGHHTLVLSRGGDPHRLRHHRHPAPGRGGPDPDHLLTGACP